jgi:hypothetical protein
MALLWSIVHFCSGRIEAGYLEMHQSQGESRRHVSMAAWSLFLCDSENASAGKVGISAPDYHFLIISCARCGFDHFKSERRLRFHPTNKIVAAAACLQNVARSSQTKTWQ